MVRALSSKTIVRVVSLVVLICLFVASRLVADRNKNDQEATVSINLSDAFGKENLVPIVIIGSGPAGLAAGLYGRREGVKTVVIEGNEPGGLLTKTSLVENWPGEISILGPTLIDKMHEQAKSVGVEFIADTVESIDTTTWPYNVTLQDGTLLHAMSIVVATGATPAKLGIAGEERYWGHGVTACAICDALFFEDKDVVVVGGGDSAVEQSFQLIPHVKSVTLLVRKGVMRAAITMQDRLKKYKKISVRYNVEPREIIGTEYDEVDDQGRSRHIKKVTHIRLYDAEQGTEILMPTSGVFLAVGHHPNSTLVKDIVACDAAGYIRMEGRTQKTSVPGIFAAGEVEDNRYKQAGVSSGRGASAALDALDFLRTIGYTPDLEMGEKQQPIVPESDTAVVLEEISSKVELDNVLATSDTPVLLDFYTPECAACKYMMPVVRNIATLLRGKIIVYKVDAEKSDDLVQAFDIRKVPTFMIIAHDRSPLTSDTIQSKKELNEFIEGYLNE